MEHAVTLIVCSLRLDLWGIQTTFLLLSQPSYVDRSLEL